MSEFYSPEKRFVRESVDLSAGPIEIGLSTHRLVIVDPERDLGTSWTVDCLVIDPAALDPDQQTGYKGLADGETIILGRASTYGRFNFPEDVSREHLEIHRRGKMIDMVDRNSSNGSYMVCASTPEPTSEYETNKKKDELAAFSKPSEYHPEVNEDAYFVNEYDLSLGVFDGVSSWYGSDVASKLASQAVAEYLSQGPRDLPRGLSHLAMNEALSAANQAIAADPNGRHIATTATVAKIFEDNGRRYAVVGSVGDSRAYLYRDGSLEHLTLDQSYQLPSSDEGYAKKLQKTLAEVSDLSDLTPEEEEAFLHRNIISGCLGAGNKRPFIAVADIDVQHGDRLLLTTDGIHDNLTDSEIASILANTEQSELAVKDLVLASLKRSREVRHLRHKPDDMTAAILRLA